MGKCRFYICKEGFWNDFCSPRCPGVFVILAVVVIALIYASGYILMGTFFDSLCSVHEIARYIHLIANSVIIVAGFLSIHFLTLKPTKMTLTYCLGLHVALIVAFIFGITSFCMQLTSPTAEDILRHAKEYLKSYRRAPYLLGQVFRERKCCGIFNFSDISRKIYLETEAFHSDVSSSNLDHDKIKMNYYHIPPTCCVSLTGPCEEWSKQLIPEPDYQANKTRYMFQQPCMKPGDTFQTLSDTTAYTIHIGQTVGVLATPLFALSILAVLNYYLCFRFKRWDLDKRPELLLSNLKAFLTCRWGQIKKHTVQIKLQDKFDKEASFAKHERHGPGSEFAIRHQMIQHSLQNKNSFKNLNNREPHSKAIFMGYSKTNLLAMKSTQSKAAVSMANSMHSEMSRMGNARRDRDRSRRDRRKGKYFHAEHRRSSSKP